MNNPMFANMAQKVMADPSALQGLMNNPQLRNLANQFGGGGANNNNNAGAQGGASSGGGGMPDLASMMNDPSLQEMAKKFMGGQGRGGGA
jgi:small glutamine-rich tetratricopeptide repeat-containing protein alpha